MATIELILGPMFSGKSTELLRRCRTYEAIDKSVVVINSHLDTRCAHDEVQTHSKQTHKAVKVQRLLDFYSTYNMDDYHIIAIDEAQFFPDLLDFIKIIESMEVVIIIAGLDGDSNRKPFGQILETIPYANTVTKLQAMCMISKDGTPAAFTQRLHHVSENSTQQIQIGDQDKYFSVCRKMYLRYLDL